MSTDSKFLTLAREGRYNLPQYNAMLPLNEIVGYVSHNFEWSPTDSIFKLIIMFCLPEMQTRWETLRSRLFGTKPKNIQKHIIHYAEEGKLLELVALLTIDPPHFCSSSADDGETERLSTLEISRERVATKIVSLIVEEQKLTDSRSNKLAQICKEKKRLMMSVMLLLEIFERIGVDIEYLVSGSHCITQSSKRAESMAKFLAFRLKDSGFPVTNELEVFKHMNCKTFLDERQGKFSGELCGSKFELKDPYFPVYMKFESPALTKLPFFLQNRTTRMPLEQQRRSIFTHSLQEKPGLCSLRQSFYMSQRFKTSFSTKTEAQTWKTFQVIRIHVPGLMLSKKISSFLSAIKRVF